MEYYSDIKKNSFESVLMRWMKVEPTIQSEISQKDKHQYSILTHIYMEFRKMVMITLYEKQKKRHRCTEQTFGLCGRREGGMFQENSIVTCILSRVKKITSPGGVPEARARGWCTGKTQSEAVGREA